MSNRCFVIGPIGDRLAPLGSERREVYESALTVFEDVIRPACAQVGLDPIRADQIAKSGEITEQIFRHLLEDEVVIADLSGANANVMYELGLRHTRDLLTITIGEYGLLPFDLSAIRTIQFSRSERGLIEARKQLAQALSIGVAEGGDPVTATRVWLSIPPEAIESTLSDEPPVQQDGVEDDEGETFLEQMAAVETSFPLMTETIEAIGDIFQQLGEVGSSLSEDVEALNTGGGSARDRLKLIGRWAGLLQPPADRLTETTAKFYREMHDVDPRMQGVLQHIREGNANESDGAPEFLDVIIGMAAASRESMEQFNIFGEAVQGLSSISKLLRRPARQIGQALNQMAAAIALIDTWESQARKAQSVLQQTAEQDHSSEGSGSEGASL